MKRILLFILIFALCACIYAAPSFSSLNRAVSSGSVILLNRYISQGVDINGRGSDGRTVLFTELFKNENASANVVRTLVDAGIDTGLGDFNGDNSLIYAIKHCKKDVILALLDSVYTDAGVETANGETTLLLEIYKGENASPDVISKLMEAGVDPRKESDFFESAVSYAITKRLEDFYNILGISKEELANYKVLIADVSFPLWARGSWEYFDERGEAVTVLISANDIVFSINGEKNSLMSELSIDNLGDDADSFELIINEDADSYNLKVNIMGFYLMDYLSLCKTDKANRIALTLSYGNEITMNRKESVNK